jgi:hypothetical protein
MIRMAILVGRRISGRDVSGEKAVGPLMGNGSKTCCCRCSRKRVVTYSQGEWLRVALITPAPQPVLQGRVTIIVVIHSDLNLTCNKKYTRFVRRVRHSESHVVKNHTVTLMKCAACWRECHRGTVTLMKFAACWRECHRGTMTLGSVFTCYHRLASISLMLIYVNR